MPARDRKGSSNLAQADLSAVGPEEARELLAAALVVDPRSGVLRLSGQPAVIIRPEALVNIQRQLEQTIGGSSKGIMYLAGERSAEEGVAPVRAMTDEPEGPLSLQGAKQMIDAFALLGWGHAELDSFDPERGRFVVRIANSPIARAYGASRKPVCHFLAGWAAGMGRTLLGRELLCEETVCASQDQPHCAFELRPMPS